MKIFKGIRKKEIAFTLAEVLITLGIIGIVAAMTIPNLMTNYAKKRTALQVKTFYSKINQTFKLSSADNGDVDGWITQKNYTYEENVEFLNQYIFPYMKHLGYNNCKENNVCVKLIDGGLMTFKVDSNGGDISYWTDTKKAEEYYKNNNIKNKPRYYFIFQFAKFADWTHEGINAKEFVEPYTFNWDGTDEGLVENHLLGCKKGCYYCAFCTKMIQLNSWEIPKDYPW